MARTIFVNSFKEATLSVNRQACVVNGGLFALVVSSVRDVVDVNKATSVDSPLLHVKH